MAAKATSAFQKIMVTCASGGLGQMTVTAMLNQMFPPVQIVAMVENKFAPSDINTSYIGKGIKLSQGDFFDYNSLATSFYGMHTLMFISSGTMTDRIGQHANVVKAAQECMIRHIVYTSFAKASPKSKLRNTEDHFHTEEIIKKSRIPYTIFRNSFYADLVPMWMDDAHLTGQFAFPAGTAKINLVAKRDIAEALARVLHDTKLHANKTYEITGARSYSFKEIAGIIGKSLGMPISYTPISLEEYERNLKIHGREAKLARMLGSGTEIVADGVLDFADPALEKILGRKPTPLEEYLPRVFARR